MPSVAPVVVRVTEPVCSILPLPKKGHAVGHAGYTTQYPTDKTKVATQTQTHQRGAGLLSSFKPSHSCPVVSTPVIWSISLLCWSLIPSLLTVFLEGDICKIIELLF